VPSAAVVDDVCSVHLASADGKHSAARTAM